MKASLSPPRSTRQLAEQTRASSHGWWFFLWVAVGVIVYGSLFPFEFEATPKPIATFFAEWRLFRNSADAIDNLFLFVPLGFALRVCVRTTVNRLWIAAMAVLVLGFGIQLLQLYLPSRTAALSDVVWNALGLGAGFLAAARLQGVVEARLDRDTSAHDLFAAQLVVLWFVYESFPFLPTLDWGLLRNHLKPVLVAPPFELMRLLQHLLAATLGGVLMLRTNWLRPNWLNVLVLGGLAVALEVFVAYGSLRREAILGMVLGLGLAYLTVARFHLLVVPMVMLLATSALLISVSIPLRGQGVGSGFTLTPFSHLLWQGLTKNISPTAFEALAVGALIWSGLRGFSNMRGRAYWWIAAVLSCVVLLECVRVYLAGYRGDTTLLAVAIVLGVFAASSLPRAALRAGLEASSIPSVAIDTRVPPPPPARLVGQGSHLWFVLGLATLLAVVLRMPGMPYNLRELSQPGLLGGVTSAMALSVTAYGMANGAFLCFPRWRRRWLIGFPIAIWIHGLVAWCLLRVGVPMESVHDIVGAPVLAWPWEWELMGRYLALHTCLMLAMLGAALCVRAVLQPVTLVDFLYWALVAMLLAWPLHLVVVAWAATDNLTELMAGGGSFLVSVALAGALFFTCLVASALSAALIDARRGTSLLMLAAVAAVAATLLYWIGTEHAIVKYGRVFSAFQFLLSTDRGHYVEGVSLTLRYATAFAMVCGGLAAIQWLSWRGYCRAAFVEQKGDKDRPMATIARSRRHGPAV